MDRMTYRIVEYTDIGEDRSAEVLATGLSAEDAGRIVSALDFYADALYELVGHSDFEDTYGVVAYAIEKE